MNPTFNLCGAALSESSRSQESHFGTGGLPSNLFARQEGLIVLIQSGSSKNKGYEGNLTRQLRFKHYDNYKWRLEIPGKIFFVSV